MKQQVIRRFETEVDNTKIQFIRATIDSCKEPSCGIESAGTATRFKTLEEAVEYYETFVDTLKKIDKML